MGGKKPSNCASRRSKSLLYLLVCLGHQLKELLVGAGEAWKPRLQAISKGSLIRILAEKTCLVAMHPSLLIDKDGDKPMGYQGSIHQRESLVRVDPIWDAAGLLVIVQQRCFAMAGRVGQGCCSLDTKPIEVYGGETVDSCGLGCISGIKARAESVRRSGADEGRLDCIAALRAIVQWMVRKGADADLLECLVGR